MLYFHTSVSQYSCSSSQISVLGCHKHLYNHMMNWTRKLNQQELSVHKKGIFLPDPALIQLTMQQHSASTKDDSIGKRRVTRKFF